MNKTQAQRIHASRRAAERYGMKFGRAEQREFVKAIQTGKSTVIEKQSHRVTVHELIIEGEPVRVVYDRIRKTIVTFLPFEEVEDESLTGQGINTIV